MSRSLVFVREAVPADAVRLAELWADLLRRGDVPTTSPTSKRVIETAASTPTSAWSSPIRWPPRRWASTCG